jgi:hypothetical protein
MKEVFEVGDRVYDFQYGWGVVIEDEHNNWGLNVRQDNGRTTVYTGFKPNTLSFTEYTLQGFSQEKPIELPEVGELCLVRDNGFENWKVRQFCYCNGDFFFTKTKTGLKEGWYEIKRIKILD